LRHRPSGALFSAQWSMLLNFPLKKFLFVSQFLVSLPYGKNNTALAGKTISRLSSQLALYLERCQA